jgi:Septum formation
MSTEATGDGKPGAVDPVEPDAGAEPTATAVADSVADVPDQASEPDAAEESDESNEEESDEPDEEYEDYDASESDEALEYGEGDERYESDEDAEPRRARLWPRVLLALGFVILAAAVVGGAVAIVGSVTHGFKKPVKVTYKTSAVFSLKTGDCFDPQGQQSYTLIPCDSPHQAEVFATFALTGTKWPGTTAVQAAASGGCASRLTGYVNPQLAISLSSTYVYPDSVAWQAGTRTVICEVRATSGELNGSVRGASASG